MPRVEARRGVNRRCSRRPDERIKNVRRATRPRGEITQRQNLPLKPSNHRACRRSSLRAVESYVTTFIFSSPLYTKNGSARGRERGVQAASPSGARQIQTSMMPPSPSSRPEGARGGVAPDAPPDLVTCLAISGGETLGRTTSVPRARLPRGSHPITPSAWNTTTNSSSGR